MHLHRNEQDFYEGGCLSVVRSKDGFVSIRLQQRSNKETKLEFRFIESLDVVSETLNQTLRIEFRPMIT